jgi:hypothetical protein
VEPEVAMMAIGYNNENDVTARREWGGDLDGEIIERGFCFVEEYLFRRFLMIRMNIV